MVNKTMLIFRFMLPERALFERLLMIIPIHVNSYKYYITIMMEIPSILAIFSVFIRFCSLKLL